MADPTVTTVTTGDSALATTVVSFTAQTAGSLLLLSVTAEAYLTTSGANRPESSGWTQVRVLGSPHWMGCSLYYKIAAGDTSVSYTIASAAGSSYVLDVATDIDNTTPLDVSAIAQSATNIGGVNAFTGPTSPTTSAGRKLGYATMHRIADGTTTGLTSPTNSFVQQSVRSRTTGDRPAVISLKRVFDGTAGTGTGGTFAAAAGGNYQHCGIIAIFNNASGGGGSTVTLTPAAVTATAVTLSPAPGQVAVTLTPVVATATAVALTATPQPVAVTLTPAVVTLTATALSPSGGSTTVTLTPAVVTTTAMTLTATPQPVAVTLTSATVTATAVALSPSGGQLLVTLTPATLTATARPLTPQGAVVLAPAAVTTSAPALVPRGAVVLVPAVVAVTAVSLLPSGGSITVTLTVATIVTTALPLSPAIQAVTVTLTAASLTLTAQPLAGTPGVVGVTLTAAQLTLTARPLSAGGPIGPIIPRVLVALLRDDGQYAGRLQDKGRYEARLR